MFSLRHLVDALLTAVKPRADSKRGYILTLLLTGFIIMINTFGESAVQCDQSAVVASFSVSVIVTDRRHSPFLRMPEGIVDFQV